MKNKLSTTLRLSRRIVFLASLAGVLHVGTYDKKKMSQSPAHDGIYLDCIKIERVE